VKRVNIKYFASVREAIGRSTEVLETEAADLAALRAELVARGGAHADALAQGKAVRMALDQVMSSEAAALTDGAEVAFFPPVTGG